VFLDVDRGNLCERLNLCFDFGLLCKKQQKKRPRKHGGLSGTSSEESESEGSDGESGKDSDDSFKSVSSADEDDDFNPFRDESDDDEEDGELSKRLRMLKEDILKKKFSAHGNLLFSSS